MYLPSVVNACDRKDGADLAGVGRLTGALFQGTLTGEGFVKGSVWSTRDRYSPVVPWQQTC
jgi:hypothetical protein